MFTRLFTFGDGAQETTAITVPAAALPAGDASPAMPTDVASVSQVAATSSDGSASPALPGVVVTATAAETPGLAACDPASLPEGASCGMPVPMATAGTEERSIMDRIGSWF
jgi:hypothetical protein